MKDIDLFQLALGLKAPWQVSHSEFNLESKRLDILIDFTHGGTFSCPKCQQAGLKAYDTVSRTWRHLNFFHHEAHLTPRVTRVDYDQCGVGLVAVLWARSGSGFTVLFEAMIMTLAKRMAVKTIAEFVNENDTHLWRIIHYYVDKAREQADHSQVNAVDTDETSKRRGRNYVRVFMDLESPRVLFATDDKDTATVERFKEDLVEHGGDPAAAEEVCCDMSPVFISGVESHLPSAHLTFDKFHIMKVVNDAVDQVRREEAKTCPELKRSRYLWLMNLKPWQAERLKGLSVKDLNLKTSRAYHIRLSFQEFFAQPAFMAEAFLKKWYFWATRSRLEPIKQAAYTIKRHWNGVLRWFDSRINNGVLEGVNSMIQAQRPKREAIALDAISSP